MVSTEATILTDRQVEVLELRERGYTQQEVADELGTTDANVSAIERAAEQNIEKARRTLELTRTIRAPFRFTVDSGTAFTDLLDEVYDNANDAGVKVDSPRPELFVHLFGVLEDHLEQNQLTTDLEIGLTEDGEVKVFADAA